MPGPKPRFGREVWIALGIALLSERGAEALTVERLTEAAGKTRGSFYHHFEDQRAYLAALGQRWLERQTDAVIAELDSGLPAAERIAALARRTAALDHGLERELRRLAVREPVIADAVAQADARRIDYLVRLFRAVLRLRPAEALARARVQHCYFVGAQMVFPDADEAFRLRLQKTLGRTLWRV